MELVTPSDAVADFSKQLEVTKIYTLDRNYLKLMLHGSLIRFGDILKPVRKRRKMIGSNERMEKGPNI